MLGRLKDVFRSFHEHDARYVVIGGSAAVVHGVPRATFDWLPFSRTGPHLHAMRLVLALLLAAGHVLADGTGTVEGRVLDPDGKGVVGATVTAYCVTTEEPLELSVKTGELGVFRFEGIAAGKYVLKLSLAEEKRPAGDDDMAKAIEAVLAEVTKKAMHSVLVKNAARHPDLVEVEAGKTATHEFRIPRRLSVQLTFSHRGKPFRGAEAELYPIDARGEATWTVERRGRGKPRTDAEGRIAFEATEGRYAVVAQIGDWNVQCGTVKVEGTQPLEFPVVLGSHEITIRVVDSSGRPVKNAEPNVAGPSDWVGVQTKAFVDMENPNGVYRVPFVVDGRHRPYVNAGMAHGACDPVDIGPNSPDPEVTVKLPPTGRVVVRVLDRDGKPVAKANMTIQHPSGTPSWGKTTDANGEIAFDNIDTGTWRVGRSGKGLDLEDARDVAVEEAKETVVEFKDE